MKIYILANRKIENVLVAEHLFREERIIDRIIALIRSTGKHQIFVASGKRLDVKHASVIDLSQMDSANGGKIDLGYVYDFRRIQKLIRKGNTHFESAIMFKSETIKDLDLFGCFYQRSEWNPIAQYYIEIWAEKLALWLEPTFVTPNMVTYLNTLFGILITGFLFLNGSFGIIIFGLWVRLYHLLDAADGQLARLQGSATNFGKWLDCGSDRLVHAIWYIGFASSLYFKNYNPIFLFIGILAIFGMFIQNHLLWTSVIDFRGSKIKIKSTSRLRTNPLSSFILFFLNGDIHYHMITAFALVGRIDILLFFYAIYYNLIWVAYFLFYLIIFLKEGDVKEA